MTINPDNGVEVLHRGQEKSAEMMFETNSSVNQRRAAHDLDEDDREPAYSSGRRELPSQRRQ